MEISDLSAEEVATKAMTIAADMCVYTNHNFRTEVLDSIEETEDDSNKEEKKKDDKN